jgi:hypothetical protein
LAVALGRRLAIALLRLAVALGRWLAIALLRLAVALRRRLAIALLRLAVAGLAWLGLLRRGIVRIAPALARRRDHRDEPEGERGADAARYADQRTATADPRLTQKRYLSHPEVSRKRGLTRPALLAYLRPRPSL